VLPHDRGGGTGKVWSENFSGPLGGWRAPDDGGAEADDADREAGHGRREVALVLEAVDDRKDITAEVTPGAVRRYRGRAVVLV